MRRFVLPSNNSSRTPARLVFILCLVAGLAVVAWRAQTRSTAVRARARIEAAACLNALEAQLHQGLSAVETVGMLAKQNGGNLSNFQQLAAEVLASHPAVATLELQPNGVVVDVAPRTGNEKRVGFNAITDPVQGPGAYAATQVRTTSFAGPLALGHGEEGFIVRYPLFERRPDGRDYFRGFVAASMRLQDFLSRARFTDLGAHGYDYLLYVPGSPQHKAATVAGTGTVPAQDTVPQTVRAQNLEFRFALRPPGGWVGKMRLVVEFAGVVLASALVASLVSLMGNRASVGSAVAEANARHARESAAQKQAQEDNRRTQEELAAAQAKLKEEHSALVAAGVMVGELQVALDAAASEARNSAEAAKARLGQAESGAAELQKQLEAAVQEKNEAVRASKKEGKAMEEAVRESQARITELQTKVDEAAQANKETPGAEDKRLERAEATIASLKEQLETAMGSAKDSAAKLKEAEGLTDELKSRLAAFEEGRAETSNRKVEEPPALEPTKAVPDEPTVQAVPTEETNGSDQSPEPHEESIEAAPKPAGRTRAKRPGPSVPRAHSKTAHDPATQPIAPKGHQKTAQGVNPEEWSEGISNPERQVRAPGLQEGAEQAQNVSSPEETPESAAIKVPKGRSKIAQGFNPGERAEEFSSPEGTTETVATPDKPTNTALLSKPDPEPEEKPTKTPKRKKSKRDNQMDLFAGPPPTDEGASQAVPAPAATPAPAKKLPPSPPVDPPELRKAVGLIMPLLMEEDPGARDCLKDHLKTFRSAFTPEGYAEFAELIQKGKFEAARDELTKAAKKHGIPA